MTRYDSERDRTRTCPSCRMRWRYNARVNPNFDTLPISKDLWKQLRSAAESFDRAISTEGNEDGTGEDTYGGSGDGRTPFTASQFVDWLREDCSGFRAGKGGLAHPEYDGIRGGRPFELPQAGRMARDDAA